MTSSPSPSDTGRILVYGTQGCSDCHLAKRVLDENRSAYDFIDIDAVAGAADEVLKLNRGMRIVPTIIFPDGTVMVEPSRRELTAKLR